MYKARVFYNSETSFELISEDLQSLKDVLCTFTVFRTDVQGAAVYKSVGSWKLIAKVEKGKYLDI